jgi:hypothetical protein
VKKRVVCLKIFVVLLEIMARFLLSVKVERKVCVLIGVICVFFCKHIVITSTMILRAVNVLYCFCFMCMCLGIFDGTQIKSHSVLDATVHFILGENVTGFLY